MMAEVDSKPVSNILDLRQRRLSDELSMDPAVAASSTADTSITKSNKTETFSPTDVPVQTDPSVKNNDATSVASTSSWPHNITASEIRTSGPADPGLDPTVSAGGGGEIYYSMQQESSVETSPPHVDLHSISGRLDDTHASLRLKNSRTQHRLSSNLPTEGPLNDEIYNPTGGSDASGLPSDRLSLLSNSSIPLLLDPATTPPNVDSDSSLASYIQNLPGLPSLNPSLDSLESVSASSSSISEASRSSLSSDRNYSLHPSISSPEQHSGPDIISLPVEPRRNGIPLTFLNNALDDQLFAESGGLPSQPAHKPRLRDARAPVASTVRKRRIGREGEVSGALDRTMVDVGEWPEEHEQSGCRCIVQ